MSLITTGFACVRTAFDLQRDTPVLLKPRYFVKDTQNANSQKSWIREFLRHYSNNDSGGLNCGGGDVISNGDGMKLNCGEGDVVNYGGEAILNCEGDDVNSGGDVVLNCGGDVVNNDGDNGSKSSRGGFLSSQ
ncbi:unnamed protein product [Phytophthora fragariaefolia]|uniref:Unnamed protein product n=1 Tax=Phytophthora fragariaefolia TaxID=1490495 RepID=A0A9W6TSH1_9STRA|nr:unnamed protein product [Phytophthora fragariaefolia]